MEYEVELRKRINDLIQKYEYNINSFEKEKIEQFIKECKDKNVQIDYAINFLEDKLKNRISRMQKHKIDELKKTDFFKYSEIKLGRKLTKEEIFEMISSFNITPEELTESMNLINNNKLSELQALITKNIIIADGYVFCKKYDFVRLNNFIAYNIKKNNIQIHAAMYDFHPLLREMVKMYGRDAKVKFNELYYNSVKDALEKCKTLLNNDLSLNGVSAISTLVKKYPEMFADNNMKVGPISEEMARSIFKDLDPNSVWGAYISREELLDLSKKH